MQHPDPHGALDRLLDALGQRPQTRNCLMAVEAPDRGFSWRGTGGGLPRSSQYCIASCTKLFAGVVLRQLADENVLDLDVPAARYLPAGTMEGLLVWKGEDLGPKITLRHLLSNTSGLPDYFEQRPRGGTSFLDDIIAGGDRGWNSAEAIARARALPPRFAPGTPGRAFYSDTNFQLLGDVMENVAGRSFGELVADRISGRLGLADTYVFGPDALSRYESVVPISAGRRVLSIRKTLSCLGAQGGVISTLDDSVTFLRAYVAGELFGPRWLERRDPWNPIFFPFRYGLGEMKFAMHPMLTLFRRVPPVVGHSGSSGILMFHCAERNIFICGGTNQLKARGAPYQFMVKALHALA